MNFLYAVSQLQISGGDAPQFAPSAPHNYPHPSHIPASSQYPSPYGGGYPAQQPPPNAGYPQTHLPYQTTPPPHMMPQPAAAYVYPPQQPVYNYEQAPSFGYMPQPPPTTGYGGQPPPMFGYNQPPPTVGYNQPPPTAGYGGQPPSTVGYGQPPVITGYAPAQPYIPPQPTITMVNTPGPETPPSGPPTATPTDQPDYGSPPPKYSDIYIPPEPQSQ